MNKSESDALASDSLFGALRAFSLLFFVTPLTIRDNEITYYLG